MPNRDTNLVDPLQWLRNFNDVVAQLKPYHFDSVSDIRLLRKCNKLLRAIDESHLWPICNKFNATERAIRWYQRVYFKANGPCTVIEYLYGIDSLIGEYVNERN